MRDYEEIKGHHSFLVSLLDSYFKGDATAARLLKGAEFKATIEFLANNYMEEALGRLEDQATGSYKNDIYQESQPKPGEYMEYIVDSKNSAENELENIRKWLRSAEHISICDPYILKGGPSPIFATHNDYAEYVANLIPTGAKKVSFYGTGFTTVVKTSLRDNLKDGRQLKFFDTNKIHDRFIIKDFREGKMLGTSIGGFGNKIFAILNLPSEDTRMLCKILSQIERGEDPMA